MEIAQALVEVTYTGNRPTMHDGIAEVRKHVLAIEDCATRRNTDSTLSSFEEERTDEGQNEYF